MTANIDLAKQSVRKLIKDLMDAVPVPPTTTTAGKARQWFGAQSGPQPTAVKVWMRQNLTQDSIYSGGTVTLTWANANAYCSDIDTSIDDFVAGPAPQDEPDASAYAFFTGNDAYEWTDAALNWMDEHVIVIIVVEL